MRDALKTKVNEKKLSVYIIAEKTGLMWITVNNYLNTNRPYSSETERKIKEFVDSVE